MFALEGRDRESWRREEAPALLGVVSCSLAVVLFSYVPDLAVAARLPTESAWRVSALLLSVGHAGILFANVASRGRAARHVDLRIGGSRPFMGVHAVGAVLAVAPAATALGLFTPWLFFTYLLNLLWLMTMSGYAFVQILIQSRATDRPDE